jgi:hypothetical protein
MAMASTWNSSNTQVDRRTIRRPFPTGRVGHVCLTVQDIHATFHTLIAAGASPLGEVTKIGGLGLAP